MISRLLFLALLAVVMTSWVSPPMALALGLLFGLTFHHPYSKQSKTASKILLQLSVVGLGFGMNLEQVLRTGRSGIVYTTMGIAGTMAIGILLGRWLKVASTSSLLISVGTAICGGSAIAAVGPIAGAREEEMSVSLGTVFILNAIALLIFPSIGQGWGLGQSQFGLWAALAIHDTSSVVGASAKYGAEALAVGATVKLARALWIVPLALGTALVKHRRTKIQWPWFILFFCLAAIANTYLPEGQAIYPWVVKLARTGLTATLFLIGSGISRETLRLVGIRPLLQGIILWVIVGTLTLLLIEGGWIHL